MVRMLGIRAISLSRPYDNGIRLTHSRRCRAKTTDELSVCLRRDQPAGQPALVASQEYGSTSPPLIQTSKWRWLAVDRPVLPTNPIS